MRRWVRRTAAAVTTAVTVWGVAHAAPSLRAWRDGPVRVLLSESEYERFGALRSDDERTAYIERFWRELEGTPADPESGFKATFEKRCAIANERFASIQSEGWRTDRGRVFLILGEPAAVRREPGGQDAVEKEVWTYAALGDRGMPLEISFYRCRDESYRVDPTCRVATDPISVSFDWERNNYLRVLRERNPQLSAGLIRQLLSELLASLPGSVSPAPVVAEAAVPGEVSGGPPASNDANVPESGALESSEYYFRAQDGSVLAFLAVRLKNVSPGDAVPAGAGPGRYIAAVSLRQSGSGGGHEADPPARSTPLAPEVVDSGAPWFFGRAYLASGRDYAIRYAVKDRARAEILFKSGRLRVPDIGTGFSASSLVPAERFGPAATDAGVYRVGSEEVVPRPGAQFRRGELLRLYLQVYGAKVDPERSMSRVDVVFRFYRLIAGASKRQGKPFSVREAAGASMGLALPVGDWPLGPYRVTVDLHDRVGGDRVTVEGSFTLVEG